jgi:hypothetical protein
VLYKVVHAPRVAIRTTPSITSPMAGTLRHGEEVAVDAVLPQIQMRRNWDG